MDSDPGTSLAHSPLSRAALLASKWRNRRLKLGDTHPHTIESLNSLIDLYEAWNKPEEAREWRVKLAQTETVEE
jgi:hypothetical protein